MHSAITESAGLARAHGRADLAERLDRARARIRSRTTTVVVVGEFKRGKSTLVNALIQTSACPVDADIVTAVPTLVRFGEQVALTARVRPSEGSEATTRPLSPEELRRVVSTPAEDPDGTVVSVEIQVPHRILRSGLQLLDTPGVGGLDSDHGQVSLSSLDGADGVLFVTDASQELTAPELDFLRSALSRCATAAVVVTKTDLHQHWRRIVELDRQHLASAGIEVPVVAVSSFLRLRAARQPELNGESGFARLVEFLATDVVQGADRRVAATVAHDVDFATAQLARQADAERVVLAEPEKGPALTARLGDANRRARALGAPDATWQQRLNDGVQDLVADVEHDLQTRLRSVLQRARDLIDESDPRTTWTETQAVLRREVAAAGVANRDLLLERAVELAESVAREFDLQAGEAVDLDLDLVTTSLEDHRLPSASSLSMPGGRLTSLLVTARTTALVPMLAFSLANLVPVLLLAGAAAVLGAGVGGKLFRDERSRQRSYRQQQAKQAAAKFVDEVAFEMNKDTRDALRRTHRQLRDEFQARARSLQASAAGALAAVQRSADLDPQARASRAAEIDDESARLTSTREMLRVVSAAGSASQRAAS